ncbi:hypothetical protein ARMSODRAFT_1023440 [Armillaria solidipes]|uniref:Uncharacterized protein n=1 Tax=Armillaria solidipes TaxID=1076256 RepID=A0A2H3AZE4_9AGAR|nr:hypothetical protein ARMSODRAFT_1023440 [Armillaria solidipes]
MIMIDRREFDGYSATKKLPISWPHRGSLWSLFSITISSVTMSTLRDKILLSMAGQIPTNYQGPSSSFGRPVFSHSITVGVVTLPYIAGIIIAPPLTTLPLLYSAKIQATPPSSPLS